MSLLYHVLLQMGSRRLPLAFSQTCGLIVALGLAICLPARAGVVATVHRLASEAAMKAMDQGGNAVDAAVAAGLTLGVVDGFNSGIGGGCFILIRRADGELIAIDGRETAPAQASPDMYIREGKADTSLSQKGALASGVPGALRAFGEANRRFGRLPLADLVLPAAEIAEKGFIVDEAYHARARSAVSALREFPASAAIFLTPSGEAHPVGARLVQTELAATYRNIATHGVDWFYQGNFADLLDQWMKANRGVMRREDLKAYQIAFRKPIRSTYRGFEIVGFPPPSSGGVHAAQILNILESFDLSALDPNGPDWVQLVVEAMKRAFADRAYWLGDPDFAPVPRGLIDEGYARELASQIERGKSSPIAQQGQPPKATTDLFGKHTTHFSVVDNAGTWVACTATVNTTYGSKVVIPGTGVVMNNEMDDFSVQPGVPNAFGLLGSKANRVEAGKRPLSSMSPTIVLKDGVPVFSVGAAGGPTIISQVVLAIIRVIDFGMTIEEALAAPRFHHQWRPNQILIERSFSAGVRESLEKMGYEVSAVNSIGVSQAVGREGVDGAFSAAADPRANGRVLIRD